MHSYVTDVLVYNLHMTIFSRVYSYVTRMLLVCTRVLLVCYSYVVVCYSYVTRMLLVCSFSHNLQQQKQCSEILAAPVAPSAALITKSPQQVENRNSASCQNNMFTNTNSPKFVDFGNAKFENCNFAFTYNTKKRSDD